MALWESSTNELFRRELQTQDDVHDLRSTRPVHAPRDQATQVTAPYRRLHRLNHRRCDNTRRSRGNAAAALRAETMSQHENSRNETRPTVCTTSALPLK